MKLSWALAFALSAALTSLAVPVMDAPPLLERSNKETHRGFGPAEPDSKKIEMRKMCTNCMGICLWVRRSRPFRIGLLLQSEAESDRTLGGRTVYVSFLLLRKAASVM